MMSHISALVPSDPSRRSAIDALRPERPFSSAERLSGDAKALSDLADRYPLGEILRENLARMCMIAHVAHKRCLSLVVQIIDEFDVLPNEPENHAPVTVDHDRVEPPEFAGQGMRARLKRASSPLCLKVLITFHRKPTSDARFGMGGEA